MKRTFYRTAFIIFLVVWFTAVSVHAESGERFLFMGNYTLFSQKYSSGLGSDPATPQIQAMSARPKVSTDRFLLEILAGFGGNIAFMYAGAFIGYSLSNDEHDEYMGSYLCIGAGSILGSSLGVCLAGNSENVRGKFGAALLGSILGEAAALGITSLLWNSEYSISIFYISFAVLPPLGAAILFNTSLRYKSLPAGNALFNFNKDRFTLGIPDLQVRPVQVHATHMKPEMQFKLNLVSVEF